jgi:hypothetical protein
LPCEIIEGSRCTFPAKGERSKAGQGLGEILEHIIAHQRNIVRRLDKSPRSTSEDVNVL